jgi:hypothetical protein
MKWRLIPLLLLLVACVDRIDFDIPYADEQFVVEGTISDQPGPHIIYLSKIFSRLPSRQRIPVTNAQIELYEDDVIIDTFTEKDDGIYSTSPTTWGRVGHSYHVVIRKNDGAVYSSAPEKMIGSGNFNNVDHEFLAATSGDRFNIYVDAQPEAEGHTRWRVKGTYRVITFPERAVIGGTGLEVLPAPLKCSGMVFDPIVRRLVRVGPCTCCECWITDEEKRLHLGDPYLLNAAGYQRTQVGEVAITPRTFYDKYNVEIEQLSMSDNAYEYFRQLKTQADGVGSLFQPSFGVIKGNISSNQPKETVLGLFWATSVTRESFFLLQSDLPYKIGAIDTIPDNCNTVGKSTYTKPDFW